MTKTAAVRRRNMNENMKITEETMIMTEVMVRTS